MIEVRKATIFGVETAELMSCEKCGGLTNNDVSQHMSFEKDEVALRCRNCRHIRFVPFDKIEGFVDLDPCTTEQVNRIAHQLREGVDAMHQSRPE